MYYLTNLSLENVLFLLLAVRVYCKQSWNRGRVTLVCILRLLLSRGSFIQRASRGPVGWMAAHWLGRLLFTCQAACLQTYDLGAIFGIEMKSLA